MAAKDPKNRQVTVTSGNMTFSGTMSEVNKMIEADLKAAIKRASSRSVKESALPLAERRKLSEKRLDKLDAERKKVKQKPAKAATPSYVKVDGVKYNVKEVRGNKIKITDPKTGNSINLPKGTGINASDIKFLKANQAVGSKRATSAQGARVTTFRRGAGLGGKFGNLSK